MNKCVGNLASMVVMFVVLPSQIKVNASKTTSHLSTEEPNIVGDTIFLTLEIGSLRSPDVPRCQQHLGELFVRPTGSGFKGLR